METVFADVAGGITTLKLVDNVTEGILTFGKENFADYRSHLIVAAEFNPVNILGEFFYQPRRSRCCHMRCRNMRYHSTLLDCQIVLP